MTVASRRRTTVDFSGDITAEFTVSAAVNDEAPGDIDVLSLNTGANTITLPTGGTTVKAATIIPPVSNEQTLTLKGVTGDSGIALNKIDPTTITFDSPAPVSFVLTAGGPIAGLRIIWS